MIRDFSFRGRPFQIVCHETFPNHPSWHMFVDEHTVREEMWRINPGEKVLDVGAAYGSYTLTAILQGAEHVWSWSPQFRHGEETEAETLTRSLMLNGWGNRCSITSHCGVFNLDGWLNTETQEFFTEKPESQLGVQSFEHIIQVEKLDTWARRVRPSWVDVMKFDVEGAEVSAILGAENTIRFFRPRIMVENHLFKRATIEQEVRDILLGWGYRELVTKPYHYISHSVYLP